MDFEEKEPILEESFEKGSEKSAVVKSGVSDSHDYFTNINGIYAKDVDGRAETAELRTLVTRTYSETVLYEINSTGSNTFSVPIATLRQYDIIGIDAGFYAAGIDPSVYTNRSNNWAYLPISALPNTIAANANLLDMSAPIVYNEIVRFTFGTDNSGNNFVVNEIRTHLPANEWPCAVFKVIGIKY